MKDVLHCDKLWEVVKKRWSVDFRMGQPTSWVQNTILNTRAHATQSGHAGNPTTMSKDTLHERVAESGEPLSFAFMLKMHET